MGSSAILAVAVGTERLAAARHHAVRPEQIVVEVSRVLSLLMTIGLMILL